MSVGGAGVVVGGREICAQHYDPFGELFSYGAAFILYT